MSAYHRPSSVKEAVALLGADNELRVLAGGTDIFPARTARAGWGQPNATRILDISRLNGLRGIEDRGDHWWIGALTTWRDLICAPLPPVFDGLKAAAREIGGVQIQNRGTLVGNCCTASPAGDGIPCLLILDAEFEVTGGVAFRIPATHFFTGYRKTALDSCELVTGIRIPKQAGHSAFHKLGARAYLVISIAMVAGVVQTDPKGRVTSARFAVGACAATAQRLPALEQALLGNSLDPDIATAAHFGHLTPIDDIRASATYRRHAALQVTRDVIADLAAQIRREAHDV